MIPKQFSYPLQGLLPRLAVISFTVALAGCNLKAEEEAKPPRPPTEVGVVSAVAEDVPLENELAGRTSPFETSEVRPQVSGIIEERLFTEGAVVKKGDTLYQIDASLFEASVAEARANLESAKAGEDNARIEYDRVKPLAQKGAVSEQAFTDATAALRSATAAVAQNNAKLQTAEINLRYSKLTAPISGRIGRSLVTTGALVSAQQTQALATIQRLDPIFVDIQQSSTALLKLRTAMASSTLSKDTAVVRLKLEDGQEYPLPGKLQFTDVTVNSSTGSVTLRAEFPNPDAILLPGMYVRAVLSQAQAKNAILVPQQSVTRSPTGDASALVVGDGDTVQRRALQVGQAVGNRWLVTEGLAPGDRVIVEGVSKVKPDDKVKVVDVGKKQTAEATENKAVPAL
jgi:membrane fusion protein (multidrug efflux system)